MIFVRKKWIMQKIVSHFETQKTRYQYFGADDFEGRRFLMPDREQIYIEYVDKVRRYVKGKIQNQQEVEDLVSSIFVKVYQNISSFDRKKASISTWIYTITRNTVIDYFKAHKILCELPGILEYTEEGFE